MIPAPKTIYSEIMDEMFSCVIKTKSEFKIQSWKRKIEKVKAIDIFQYKILTVAMAGYENKNEEGIRVANTIFSLTRDLGKQAEAHRIIGNLFFQQGKFNEAFVAYWNAYDLTLDPEYYKAALSVATSFDLYDSRLRNMKSFDSEAKNLIDHELTLLESEISKISDLGFNINIYRDVLSAAYQVFFTHCAGRIVRKPNVTDANISCIFYNTDLDLETIGVLNDDMTNILVDMLDRYDYEELLKYPVLFTSEKYGVTAN